MRDFFAAFILGCIEGITEFLPISSTGHLILVHQWIKFEIDFQNMFDVVIQLGAICAVILHYRHRFLPAGLKNGNPKNILTSHLWLKICIGAFPALAIGFFTGNAIQSKLLVPQVVAGTLIGWGFILILIEKHQGNKSARIHSIENLGYGTALGIGMVQCLALIPGTSRSAATIIGAMLLGCSRLVAAEFSFFLAIPVMVAASCYSLLKYGIEMNGHELLILVIGFITSFTMAAIVLRKFFKYVESHTFICFGIYRIIVGMAVVIMLFLAK